MTPAGGCPRTLNDRVGSTCDIRTNVADRPKAEVVSHSANRTLSGPEVSTGGAPRNAWRPGILARYVHLLGVMGQRSAIAMFLWGGGWLIPVGLLLGAASPLGRAATPAAVAMLTVGFASLVASKWPLLRNGRLMSFGPRLLSASGRRFYWAGYALIGCGVILALAALPVR